MLVKSCILWAALRATCTLLLRPRGEVTRRELLSISVVGPGGKDPAIGTLVGPWYDNYIDSHVHVLYGPILLIMRKARDSDLTLTDLT